MFGESKDVKFEKLISFKNGQKQMQDGNWIQQLADCITRAGLMDSVIVRPADNGKYEVICGHNRLKALEMLGCEVIHVDIRNGLSDEDATELYYNSCLNQQPFSACSYAQRFETVKCYEEMMKKNSRQGKRTDLEEKVVANAENTCVQPMSSLGEEENAYVQLTSNHSNRSRRPTNRDETAHHLGISTATLSKYRRIIKLPDDLLQSIAYLLDEKRITFEIAYFISSLRDADIKSLIKDIIKYPDGKLDWNTAKELPKRTDKKSDDIIYPRSRKSIWRH